jgi:Uma2 family endonuclease
MAAMAPVEALHRFSTAEYDRLVASGALEDVRVELLDGLLVDVSPPGPEHVLVIQRLMRHFAGRIDLVRIQQPLACAEGWTPEPDVALAADAGPHAHPTTALLAVEVAVTNHAEARRKLPGYALAGIPLIWLVDVPAGAVEVRAEPRGSAFGRVRLARGDDALDPGVEGIAPLRVGELLAGIQVS